MTIKTEKIFQHDIVKCPYCKISMKPHCLDKRWSYNKIEVHRYECVCGENFNFYQAKTSFWTIPKHPERGKK